MKNLPFYEPSSYLANITPAYSEVMRGPESQPRPAKKVSKLRCFLFPHSIDSQGVSRIISVDFLRGMRIYSIILSAEINELLARDQCHVFVQGLVVLFNYCLSCCRFILCQLIAVYGAYNLCYNTSAKMATQELKNIGISALQVPFWLLFDLLQAQLKRIASGSAFTLSALFASSYPDLNIFAYIGLSYVPYQTVQLALLLCFSRARKTVQIKLFAATALTLSYAWFFAYPFVSSALNREHPEAPLFCQMNASYRNYFVCLFSNFFDGRKFSLMQLFPLHLQGMYYGAIFALCKRGECGRKKSIALVAVPALIASLLYYPIRLFAAYLVASGRRTYVFNPYKFIQYAEPGVLTVEYVVFLNFWQALMIFASFLFFETPTRKRAERRADRCFALRRYSTLAWWGVGRNYCTSIFLRQLFGVKKMTWMFLLYLPVFITCDYLVICSADLFRCVLTHDWVLSATRAWINGQKFEDMQNLHRKVSPATLAAKDEISQCGTAIL